MARMLYGVNALWRERSGGRAGLSRGLAGVLPPTGQIFEKLHLLEYFVNSGEFVCAFQAGV